MHRLLVIALSLSACTASYGLRGGTTNPPPPPRVSYVSAPPSAPPPSSGPAAVDGPAYAPGDDRHFFAADDYLVTRERNDGNVMMHMAKLMSPPTDASKGEGRFLVANGKEMWTSQFYLSRPAESADFVVGATAFCLYPATYRTTNHGPRNKQDAREHGWTMGAITDTSNLYKGRVSVGRHSCPIGALRVPIK